MPKDAPALKIERTRAFGGEVVLYDRYTEDRVAIGGAIAEARGMVVVPPFEDRHVIAGQGTLALEALRQAQALGLVPNRLLVCCGGGGLTAGCALAAEGVSPGTVVHPVEPVGFDDYARSLAGGVRVGNPPGNRSLCDAIVTDMPGAMTFAITQPRVGAGLTVSDDEALAAIAFAVRELKLVVEPGGVVALAALLAGRVATRGEVTMVVVTGGNVDPAILARAITDAERPRFAPRG
jgi:threonine dehydratase